MADSEYHLHLHHLQRDEDIIEKTGLELANENQELPVLSDEFLDKYLLRDTKTLMVEDTADGLIKWLDLVTRPILMQLCIKDNEKRKRLQRTAGNRRGEKFFQVSHCCKLLLKELLGSGTKVLT